MDMEQIAALAQLLDEANLTEIEIEEDGRRIRVQRASNSVNTVSVAPPAVAAAPAPAADPADPEEDLAASLEGLSTINSPMVGTFYSAPAPGESPFVKIGDRVEDSDRVEAMKLMNEVAAKFACIIERVLVENGQPVEFGQPLFAVRPI